MPDTALYGVNKATTPDAFRQARGSQHHLSDGSFVWCDSSATGIIRIMRDAHDGTGPKQIATWTPTVLFGLPAMTVDDSDNLYVIHGGGTTARSVLFRALVKGADGWTLTNERIFPDSVVSYVRSAIWVRSGDWIVTQVATTSSTAYLNAWSGKDLRNLTNTALPTRQSYVNSGGYATSLTGIGQSGLISADTAGGSVGITIEEGSTAASAAIGWRWQCSQAGVLSVKGWTGFTAAIAGVVDATTLVRTGPGRYVYTTPSGSMLLLSRVLTASVPGSYTSPMATTTFYTNSAVTIAGTFTTAHLGFGDAYWDVYDQKLWQVMPADFGASTATTTYVAYSFDPATFTWSTTPKALHGGPAPQHYAMPSLTDTEVARNAAASDEFTDGVVAPWVGLGSVVASEANDVMTVTTTGTGNGQRIERTIPIGSDDISVVARLSQMTASSTRKLGVSLLDSAGSGFGVIMTGSTVVAARMTTGVAQTASVSLGATTAADWTTYNYYRLRRESGTYYAGFSRDNIAWTEVVVPATVLPTTTYIPDRIALGAGTGAGSIGVDYVRADYSYRATISNSTPLVVTQPSITGAPTDWVVASTGPAGVYTAIDGIPNLLVAGRSAGVTTATGLIGEDPHKAVTGKAAGSATAGAFLGRGKTLIGTATSAGVATVSSTLSQAYNYNGQPLLQAGKQVGGTGGLNVPIPPSVAGDTWLLAIVTYSPTRAFPAGWTLVPGADNKAGSVGVYLLRRAADPSITSVALADQGTQTFAQAFNIVGGLDPSQGVDGIGLSKATGSNSASSVTYAAANVVASATVLGLAGNEGSGGHSVPGWTELADTNAYVSSGAYLAYSSSVRSSPRGGTIAALDTGANGQFVAYTVALYGLKAVKMAGTAGVTADLTYKSRGLAAKVNGGAATVDGMGPEVKLGLPGRSDGRAVVSGNLVRRREFTGTINGIGRVLPGPGGFKRFYTGESRDAHATVTANLSQRLQLLSAGVAATATVNVTPLNVNWALAGATDGVAYAEADFASNDGSVRMRSLMHGVATVVVDMTSTPPESFHADVIAGIATVEQVTALHVDPGLVSQGLVQGVATVNSSQISTTLFIPGSATATGLLGVDQLLNATTGGVGSVVQDDRKGVAGRSDGFATLTGAVDRSRPMLAISSGRATVMVPGFTTMGTVVINGKGVVKPVYIATRLIAGFSDGLATVNTPIMDVYRLSLTGTVSLAGNGNGRATMDASLNVQIRTYLTGTIDGTALVDATGNAHWALDGASDGSGQLEHTVDGLAVLRGLQAAVDGLADLTADLRLQLALRTPVARLGFAVVNADVAAKPPALLAPETITGVGTVTAPADLRSALESTAAGIGTVAPTLMVFVPVRGDVLVGAGTTNGELTVVLFKGQLWPVDPYNRVNDPNLIPRVETLKGQLYP